MRRPFIAGNWKMNTRIDEAVSLVAQMLEALDHITGVEKVLCPPFISLKSIRDMIQGTSVRLGAQNMYFKEKGAFTGEISPVMLKDLCQYVIIGHSERRQYFRETDAMVNNKLKSALANEVWPILCIGESLDENESGRTQEVLARQTKTALEGVTASQEIVIAYEPVWAIGTGKAAGGAQAGSTIGFIRDTVGQIWSNETAGKIRILYGGSVKGNNIDEFLSESQIDGALVGGASLDAAEFISIIKQTAAIKSAP